jgi:hypothetical protein
LMQGHFSLVGQLHLGGWCCLRTMLYVWNVWYNTLAAPSTVCDWYPTHTQRWRTHIAWTVGVHEHPHLTLPVSSTTVVQSRANTCRLGATISVLECLKPCSYTGVISARLSGCVAVCGQGHCGCCCHSTAKECSRAEVVRFTQYRPCRRLLLCCTAHCCQPVVPVSCLALPCSGLCLLC